MGLRGPYAMPGQSWRGWQGRAVFLVFLASSGSAYLWFWEQRLAKASKVAQVLFPGAWREGNVAGLPLGEAWRGIERCSFCVFLI